MNWDVQFFRPLYYTLYDLAPDSLRPVIAKDGYGLDENEIFPMIDTGITDWLPINLYDLDNLQNNALPEHI